MFHVHVKSERKQTCNLGSDILGRNGNRILEGIDLFDVNFSLVKYCSRDTFQAINGQWSADSCLHSNTIAHLVVTVRSFFFFPSKKT